MMAEGKADYHIHSCYSDGTLTPAELVRKYSKEGYTRIAVTDHDGTDGIKEAMEEGKACGLEVIPGIELSTEHHEIEVHILGYGFDPDNSALQNTLGELRRSRRQRNEKMRIALRKLGFPLEEEDLRQRPEQRYVGKPNFARALAAKGYIANPKEAFTPGFCLEAPEIKVLKKKMVSTEQGITLITQAGGSAVLAHPGKIKKIGKRGSREFWECFERLLQEWISFGLKGIECYYPEHSEEEVKNFIHLAEKYDLGITRGSDFHGTDLKK